MGKAAELLISIYVLVFSFYAVLLHMVSRPLILYDFDEKNYSA